MPRRRINAAPKVRTTVYFDPDMYAQIEALATRWHMPITRVIEDLSTRGLALASGEQVERDALPAIRAVIETVLREELLAMAKRLTGLTQKGVREAAIGTRLVRELARSLEPSSADAWYAAAERDAGRLLAERTPPGE